MRAHTHTQTIITDLCYIKYHVCVCVYVCACMCVRVCVCVCVFAKIDIHICYTFDTIYQITELLLFSSIYYLCQCFLNHY